MTVSQAIESFVLVATPCLDVSRLVLDRMERDIQWQIHCFKRSSLLVGVVSMSSNLRIWIISVSIRKLIFQLKIVFTRFNALPETLDRVQCYILATECAIGTLCPLLYSAQTGESAGTTN